MNKPIIVIMLALSSMLVSCTKFPFKEEDPEPKTETPTDYTDECPTVFGREEVLGYSYSGEPMMDGCGSVFTHADGTILIPEVETQVPDDIKNRQTFAPAKYLVRHRVVGINNSWQCGINPEKKKALVIRILSIQEAPNTCTGYPIYNR